MVAQNLSRFTGMLVASFLNVICSTLNAQERSNTSSKTENEASHTLTLVVNQLPSTHQNDPIFLTGNFNNWNPGEAAMQLIKNTQGHYSIKVALKDVPSDRLEFKLTRGNWLTSESSKEGRLLVPRVAELGSDTTIYVNIEGWRDDFPLHTASENVHLLDAEFYMPQLNRSRKIWIYLPADYHQDPNKNYPVLYMQDGQHLFDEATSQGRIGPIEWGVDETLDESASPCIVVAINHQDDYRDREPEFYFHPNSNFENVEGQDYLKFIVETLKPYVDEHYRTITDAEHTGIAGSSLGGLISFYAGIHYPQVFGKLGIFSPSIWLDEGNIERDILRFANEKASLEALKSQEWFFYAGHQENRRKEDGTFVKMHDDVFRVVSLLKEIGLDTHKIHLHTDPAGRHGAIYWRTAFPVFHEWLSRQNSWTDK
jgi:predicted alpha/beta superfamily hydrolase